MKANLNTYVEQLKRHAEIVKTQRIASLFDLEANRLQHTTVNAAGLSLDISKNLINSATLELLVEMAQAAGVIEATTAMFAGEEINRTERRAALHTALRATHVGDPPSQAPYLAQVSAVQGRMQRLVEAVRDGRRRGYSGASFTDVVNIGIGGSHLGPQLACDALRYAGEPRINAHFLANVDGGEFDRIVNTLNPATTLFIVASKSFSTVETRLNANSAKAWLGAWEPDAAAVSNHFVAVTANIESAAEFGIDADNVFPIWDWVGGRYSMWSAIGLPIALRHGMPVFRDLLSGAEAMDSHFRDSPLQDNMPLILAMLGIWNNNFLGAESYAVIPYDDRLRYLPDYLQQLEMESNGKRVTLGNAALEHHSAPVTWGGLGTNAQHAFFQLLHQGTRFIPIDFVIALKHPAAARAHHDMLVANCLAQAEGLMNGRAVDENDIGSDGINLAPHRETPGNRPSSLVSMDELTPATLGALIALYEHKTFVQSVVWDINAFDQWGVELGKQLASTILEEVSGGPSATHDPSTAALIKRYRVLRDL